MESSEFISTDKATVIIQVNPQVAQHTVTSEDGQETRGAYHNAALTEFFRAQPKALGTVQIMTGVMVFLFGIVRTKDYGYGYPISVITGITYWGSLIYISAGSLSVAAQNKIHLCVVRISNFFFLTLFLMYSYSIFHITFLQFITKSTNQAFLLSVDSVKTACGIGYNGATG
uniref:Uncharacterized protein n=1 Tax=Cyprinus carpio TaxID=7962 RepID=A0A8C1ISB1_CYPCA